MLRCRHDGKMLLRLALLLIYVEDSAAYLRRGSFAGSDGGSRHRRRLRGAFFEREVCTSLFVFRCTQFHNKIRLIYEMLNESSRETYKGSLLTDGNED